MSDTSRVESDTKHGENVMRALADTQGMPTPQKANYWLEKLAQAHYRGRHDTWTAARDRAAKKAGVEPTMAQRIWQRWQTMNDVGGETVIKLMLAYEEMIQRNDAAAEGYKAERLTIRNTHEANRKSA
ncbi:hypothetical protein QFZ34_002089 [Phyllobacterium ifriqiyense]|uniref:Uncharacterized protein n=1 Tax=Phyllobacterium ifriqiyense TaxID=314238 RepID=A0ABU0S829_9HYPH|nr:hypothetical protein [Phyllobacterium ifriqiyense]MDQ0996907.1 hypothetical protein [Phyllobacterium ifriqiyense]